MQLFAEMNLQSQARVKIGLERAAVGGPLALGLDFAGMGLARDEVCGRAARRFSYLGLTAVIRKTVNVRIAPPATGRGTSAARVSRTFVKPAASIRTRNSARWKPS